MQRLEAAQIHMLPNFEHTLLFPRSYDWERLTQAKPLVPFDNEVVEMLNALSQSILKDSVSRVYPDVVTFAFFCRKGNIQKLAEQYRSDELRMGRGVVFHIAPSNVPINFGYSMVAGLLAGNVNVVRVSNKPFPQVDLVIKHITKIAEQYPIAAERIILVRYDHLSNANNVLSSVAAVRVIWGGDQTIATIRENAIPPRSFDVCFADRYSIAAILPSAINAMSDEDIHRLGERFYNDTYLFDQNACSAPHLICWLKESGIEEAKKRFWDAVYEYASARYQLQDVMSVDKLTALYRQAVAIGVKSETMPDNMVVRTQLNDLPDTIDEFRCAGGYFSEYDIESLDEIARIVTPKYQTLAYYGFEQNVMRNFVERNQLTGIDRMVPIGETTAFSLTWDGYDLIRTLSRIVEVR